MLRVCNLKKTFAPPDGTPAVPVVDVEQFSLTAGEQVALLGSSGSGKTTLLHLLAGILAADSGEIAYAIAGTPPANLSLLSEAARDHFRGQHIGYIFQTHHLLPGLTALENVLLGMSFTGRRADRPWATHLLERVGLSHRLAYKPGKMSVGQQQRVAVARALANRPQLVLADEPTGALDSTSALQTMELIRSLCTEVNAALLLVTHDLAIAGKLSKQLQLTAINRAAHGPAVAQPPLAVGGVA
ncbi:MAG TPA: ABC transporter ATP-binding protein [Phycisphaerae bacterium]|jgi:putative ABC transport system ATP-binding protein|nr:ABC transporter ATP-binding protein [Phycisphaerae bacterium]